MHAVSVQVVSLPGLTVVSAMATTEYRRRTRVVFADRTKLLLMGAIGLFALGPLLLFGTILLPMVGSEVAAGNIEAFDLVTVTDVAMGGSALVWFGLVVFAAMRAVGTAGKLEQPACVLLATTPRSVVLGRIGGEILVFGTWLVPLTLVLSGAFAYGAGTVWPVIGALALLVVLLGSSFPVGFLLGLAVRHLLTVYEPIARYRLPLVIPVAVAYVGAITMGWIDQILTFLFTLFSETPLGWPGHLLLASLPGVSFSPGAVVGALGLTALIAALAVAGATRVGERHWFADPFRDESEATSESDPAPGRLTRLLELGLPRPVQTVTITAIRRTKRAPVRLLYVAYPLFFAVFFIPDIVQAGSISPTVAVLVCLYIVWGAGALFTLNPLGDLGPALPAVVTTTVSGRSMITGRIVAGALVAVPLALFVSLGVGVASPLSLEQTGVLVAATTVGAIASPALATGVGSLFPRFGTVTLTSNRDAVMPSKSAFAGYTLALALPVASAVVLYTGLEAPVATAVSTLLAQLPGPTIRLQPAVIAGGAWAVLVAGVIAPPLSAVYATRRFNGFVQE